MDKKYFQNTNRSIWKFRACPLYFIGNLVAAIIDCIRPVLVAEITAISNGLLKMKLFSSQNLMVISYFPLLIVTKSVLSVSFSSVIQYAMFLLIDNGILLTVVCL
jgi:hypothetical protein